MLELIKNLLIKWSCSHDWEQLEEVCTYANGLAKRPWKRTYLYRCKKCGKFKKIIIE